MANNPYVNKVQLADGRVLIDLTSDTVDAAHLLSGYTAHDATGAAITGTATGGGGSSGAPWDIDIGLPSDDDPWVRPNDWPNLDAITIGANEEVCYLTYDLRKTPGYGWIGLYGQVSGSGAKWIVERGHLVNNVFVADTHDEFATKIRYMEELDPENGNVQLFKITSTSGQITQLSFASIGDTNATCLSNFDQPCVERAGRLPYLTTLAGTRGARTTYYCSMTHWLQKDSMAPGELANPTSLASYYQGAYDLKVVDFSKWKTANWTKMASLQSMFNNCYTIREIDFTGWDTSKWIINTVASLFSGCYSLKRINFGDIKTDTWAVTTLAAMFTNCYSIESIDLSEWDVSNWQVTTLAGMFQYCRSLKTINLHGWDTEDWAVTTLANLFGGCYSLQSFDLDEWDTSNWVVTTVEGMFMQCQTMTSIILPDWDTEDWEVTTVANLFSTCYSLKSVNVSNWDTSNWVVTTIASMFANCWSLEYVNLDVWDMSEWRVTTVSALFQSCYSLKEFKPHWNTKDWPLATVTSMFASCYSLREVDMSALDDTSWVIATASTICQNCYNLETFIFPPDGGAPVTTASSPFSACNCLINFQFIAISVAWSLSGFNKLTRTSLLNCLDSLPTTSVSRTFTIGQDNKLKLTSEELAIGTSKGWTIA